MNYPLSIVHCQLSVTTLLVSLFFVAGGDSLPQQAPFMVAHDDTLREVVVRPDSLLPIDKVLKETLKKNQQPRVPTISDLLEKIKPGLNDIIMYPTAFKERRKEKRMKKMLKTLNEYDRVRTFDELLREAYEQQLLEDSIAKLKAGKAP